MSAAKESSPLSFFLLVFGLAIPFWVISAITKLQLMPGLPLAALAFVCPMISALILVYSESGFHGTKELLVRTSDYKRIKAKIWYVPILLLYPCVLGIAYGLTRLAGVPVSIPFISIPSALLLFAIFFFAAAAEELGWSGYAIDPMQSRLGPLPSSLVLGFVWAGFHYVPLVQVGRSVPWVAWWSLFTVAARVIIVWLYNSTGRSVLGVALFHTTLNVGWQLYGPSWDPRRTGLIMAAAATIIVVVQKSLSLTRPRRASREESNQARNS